MSHHYMEFNIWIEGDKENLIDLTEKLNRINDTENKEESKTKELKFYLEKYIEENQKISLSDIYTSFGMEIYVSSIEENGFSTDIPFESFGYKVVAQLAMLNPNVRITGSVFEILTTLGEDLDAFDFKSIIGDDKVKFKILNLEEDSHSYGEEDDDYYDEEDDEIKEDTYSEGYYYTIEEFCDSME